MNSNKIAVYGTLRVGMGNWGHFLRDTATLVQENDGVQGYSMHTHGYIPVIVATGNPNDVVRVDVFDDVSMIDGIDRMELGAGYDMAQVTTLGGHDVKVYTYSNSRNTRRIESGDWKVFLAERNQL